VPDRGLSARLKQAGPIPLDVAFGCEAHEVLAIFGPTGSGKTTILRTLAGLYRPDETFVACGGQVWADTATGAFVEPHHRAVGFVFHDYALFPHLTCAGNVAAALNHAPVPERARRAKDLLRLVGLADKADRRPQLLSGGERQRVALARALARDPAVLLLDEPFAAVDRDVRRRLQAEIDVLRGIFQMPVVLVTHDYDDVVRLATHVLVLDAGRTVAAGPVTSVMSRPDVKWLRDAVGLGTVFDATVASAAGDDRLARLAFDTGVLLVPDRELTAGTSVRVRVPARDVILAIRAPEGLSLHNVLSGTVSSLAIDSASDHALVTIAIGGLHLLAEVTRDAIVRLNLATGSAVYALIKSVSIELLGVQRHRD
jgi:molybdate transport system ATP-binding protein